MQYRFVLSLLASVGAFGSVSAHAALVAPTTTTYTFAGTCSDCKGTAGAELVLQNYTLGSPITTANFLSFHYDGTDLLSAYTITVAQANTVGGAINGPLPAPEQFYVFSSIVEGQRNQFISEANGSWCTGGACLSDYGSTHLWSAAPLQAVPEPISLSLLGTGLCAALATRRRRR